MKVKLDTAQIEKIYPEAKGFVPNRTTDFDRMAEILGSRDPQLVWACINAYSRPAARAADAARVAKLKTIMSKS